MSHYRQLFELAESCQPQKILEVGTWDGAHAFEIIRIAQKYNADIEYYGFDLFAPAPAFELPKVAQERARVERLLKTTGAKVLLYEGNTRETFPAVVDSLPVMDFIFVDGGHSLETIASDWACVQKLMSPDTVVLFDDYYPERTDAGCKSLVDSLGNNYEVHVGSVTEYPSLRVCMATVRLA